MISRPKTNEILASNENEDEKLTANGFYQKLMQDENSIWNQRGLIKTHQNEENPMALKNRVKIPYKMVHLDLKGAPPKIKYLTETVLPLVAAAGGNSILLEYEDMFPFDNALANTTHRSHYSQVLLQNYYFVKKPVRLQSIKCSVIKRAQILPIGIVYIQNV